jgi:DNA uptake protein ComE-like DNA-binding protein
MKFCFKPFGLIATQVLASGLLLATPAPPPAVTPTSAAPAVKPKPKMVEINKAKKAELMKLPGITATLADKIIAGRPYLTKTNLVTHNVLPMANYQGIRSLIYVIPPKLPLKK